jgi:hypothetical protein
MKSSGEATVTPNPTLQRSVQQQRSAPLLSAR